MKKILVITTGGTIAMKKDRETGGLMPAVSGKDLAALCRDWRIMLTWTCWNFPISPADG